MPGAVPVSPAISQIPTWGWFAIGAVLVVQVVLVTICIVDLSRRTDVQVLGGRRWVWLLVILFINAGIGAIIYLAVGRGPAAVDEGAIAGLDTGKAASAVDSLYGAPKDEGPR
jgi:hypothetical protein